MAAGDILYGIIGRGRSSGSIIHGFSASEGGGGDIIIWNCGRGGREDINENI